VTKTLLTTIALFFLGKISSAQTYFPPLIGSTWDTLSPIDLGWCPDKINELYDYLGNTQTKAFIVLKNGKIVLEKYYGSFTSDSLHVWNSAGKTLTAYALGIAQTEGNLMISEPSTTYLGTGYSSMTGAQENAITIKDHLQMTTGMDDGVADPFCTDQSCLTYLANPGSRWAYHNAPYTILDQVILNATGAPSLNNYVNDKIGSKIGMGGFYVPIGFNTIYISKPRHFARFGLLLSQNGVWGSTTVQGDLAYLDQMVNSSQTINPSYGYLTWLNGKSSFMIPQSQINFPGSLCPNAPADMFCALGKNAQICAVIPSENLVVVRMGKSSGTGLVEIPYVDSIIRRITELPCMSNIETKNEFTFSVFPNPTTTELTIQGDLNKVSVEVTNALGQKVVFEQVENTINTSGFSKGFYTIRIQGNDYVKYMKFYKE
jgi:CubicO group peptidase (beta-lactamase class C family)